MNERIKFIAAFLEGNENFAELCERFGISRKQGYKWRERYESGGLDGMKDRSRAPHHHPGAVVEPIATAARYRPSTKPFPSKLPELEYPAHFRVQQAMNNGVISIDGVQFYISNCVDEEYLGLEQVDEACWKVYFGPVALGLVDVRRAKPIRNRRLFSTLVRLDGTQR
jgi:hypothetical protein